MDIRSSFDNLRSILGVTDATPATQRPPKDAAPSASDAMWSDRATLSSAGSEFAQARLDTGVRADKVAAIQTALAAGTYDVPASAVASKLVDVMLGGSAS